MTVAEPIPPPAHIAATPTPPPRRRSSCTSVTNILAPVAATGCPNEQPLPLTFTRSGSRSSNLTVATHIAANASLISNKSTSDIERPARARAFGIASTGASPVAAGSTPTDAQDRTVASAGRPKRSLALRFPPK